MEFAEALYLDDVLYTETGVPRYLNSATGDEKMETTHVYEVVAYLALVQL